MATLITVLIFIVCVLLALVILIQNPKGGGLSSGFSNANQIGGVQKTTDFLEKSTWVLAISLMVLSVLYTPFSVRNNPVDENETNFGDQLEVQAPVNPGLPTTEVPVDADPGATDEADATSDNLEDL